MYGFSLSGIHLVNDGSVEVAIMGEGGSIKTTDMVLTGFPVAYDLNSCFLVSIEENKINLPFPKDDKQLIRAIIAKECKTIHISNNIIFFQALLDFEKIKKDRMITYGIK